MENNKPSRPQGLSIGIGLVFGVVLYVLTNEAVWIGVGIALGAAREIRSRRYTVVPRLQYEKAEANRQFARQKK